MGLLSLGTPLVWEDCKLYADHIRYHGIQQFINVWHKTKERQNDVLLWGDEVSDILFVFLCVFRRRYYHKCVLCHYPLS
jgi:glutamate--cysteine ligase catalytic subunit